MDFKHEIVIPNEDLTFRMFLFEGHAGGYAVAKHWHQSIEIFAVYEGEMDYYINEKEYHLTPGKFVLLNSNEIHSINVPEKNYTIVLQIPLKTFEKYYSNEQYILFSHSPREEDKKIMNLIKSMFEEYEAHKIGYEFKVQSKYFRLLYELVAKYRVENVEEALIVSNKKLSRLSKVTAYIKEHHAEKISLEQIAKIFGYAPAYLSRMFQQYAKVNFKDYLKEIRLESAYKEMLNSSNTLSDIALNNGFPNEKAFSKAFFEKYGQLPSEYRKCQKSAIN
nr:AraC family transcriptional regulator [uncultured Cellulosilyticum sp.]